MNINEFAKEVHENAVKHGFWNIPPTIPEALCLIHSEISEALEEYRNGRPMVYYPCNAGGICDKPNCGSKTYNPNDPEACSAQSKKPEGVAVELADAVIRIFDLCAYFKIDIEAVLATKHKYNLGRPYRHGGKKL